MRRFGAQLAGLGVAAASSHARADTRPQSVSGPPDSHAHGRAVARNAAGSFSFAVIGDVPYSKLDIEQTRQVLTAIDERYQFVIHVGDFKSSTDSCSDRFLDERVALLAQSARPMIFVPGDNDWTDCLKDRAGSFRPFNRLAYLRRRAFGTPHSMGQRQIGVEQQSSLQPRYAVPENLRWTFPGVMFVTLNRPGGVDLRLFSNEESREYADLHEANEVWLKSAFDHARRGGIRLMVIAAHANPSFENDHTAWRPRLKRDRHARFRQLLADLASRYDGQVLFIHGDTHAFQVNQPLLDRSGEELPNLTRLESFGTPFSGSWVQVRVTPERSPMFTIITHHLDPTRRR